MRKPMNEQSDDPVLVRIMELLKEQGKTEKELVLSIGLGATTFNRWKYGGQKSFMKHLDEISEFLGVTPGYLLKGEDDDVYNDTEKDLIRMYRTLGYDNQQCVKKVIENFYSLEKFKK